METTETLDLEIGTCNADQAGHDEAGHEGEGEGNVGEGEDGAVPGGKDKASPAEDVEEAKEAHLPPWIMFHLENPVLLFWPIIASVNPFLFFRPHNHFTSALFLQLGGVIKTPCRRGVSTVRREWPLKSTLFTVSSMHFGKL